MTCRGLEDLDMTCSSVHSQHSSGQSKDQQEYRWNLQFAFITWNMKLYLLGKTIKMDPVNVWQSFWLVNTINLTSLLCLSRRRFFFGPNEIDVKVPSLFKLLVKEVRSTRFLYFSVWTDNDTEREWKDDAALLTALFCFLRKLKWSNRYWSVFLFLRSSILSTSSSSSVLSCGVRMNIITTQWP